MISGTCERCGIEFSGRSSVKRFCSEICRKLEEKRRARSRRPKPKTARPSRILFVCSGCGSDVHKPERGRSPAFPLCSPCRVKVNKAPYKRPVGEAAIRARDLQRDRLRKRRREDAAFRFRQAFSARVRQSLRGGKDHASWESLVGYSLRDLRQHIERQFASGMSWENYGDWHVDHVVPVTSFSFDGPAQPEFHACWALSNLRPLWAGPNISKGGQRLHLL